MFCVVPRDLLRQALRKIFPQVEEARGEGTEIAASRETGGHSVPSRAGRTRSLNRTIRHWFRSIQDRSIPVPRISLLFRGRGVLPRDGTQDDEGRRRGNPRGWRLKRETGILEGNWFVLGKNKGGRWGELENTGDRRDWICRYVCRCYCYLNYYLMQMTEYILLAPEPIVS